MTNQEDSLDNVINLEDFLEQKKEIEPSLIQELSNRFYYTVFEGIITSVKVQLYSGKIKPHFQSDFWYISKDKKFPKRDWFMSDKKYQTLIDQFMEEECKRGVVPFLLDPNIAFRKAKGYFCEIETVKEDKFPAYVLEILNTEHKDVISGMFGMRFKAQLEDNSFRYIKKIDI